MPHGKRAGTLSALPNRVTGNSACWETKASSLPDGSECQCHHSEHSGSNLPLTAEVSQFGPVSGELLSREGIRPKADWGQNLPRSPLLSDSSVDAAQMKSVIVLSDISGLTCDLLAEPSCAWRFCALVSHQRLGRNSG